MEMKENFTEKDLLPIYYVGIGVLTVLLIAAGLDLYTVYKDGGFENNYPIDISKCNLTDDLNFSCPIIGGRN